MRLTASVTASRLLAGLPRRSARLGPLADDLLIDATKECFASTRQRRAEDVDAYWLGTMSSGQSGLVLSRPCASDYKPVPESRTSAPTGSEAFRNACYAVASGASTW